MKKLARSYILSILITTLMTSAVCAQNHSGESDTGSPPQAGEPFPHFQLTSTEYQTVYPHKILKDHPILMIYYRGGW